MVTYLFDLNSRNAASQETISALFSEVGQGLPEVDNHSFERKRMLMRLEILHERKGSQARKSDLKQNTFTVSCQLFQTLKAISGKKD